MSSIPLLDKMPLVKYNPNKTHFEQALQLLGYVGNPNITLEQFINISISFVDKLVEANQLSIEDAEKTKSSLMEDVKHDIHTYSTYIRDGKKNYRISKDFSHALADASLDISCKYIPKVNTSYNIQFHKDVVLKSMFGEKEISYRNCYISVEDCDTEYDKEQGYVKRIMVVFPIYQYGEDYISSYDFINLVFKNEDQKVSEAIQMSAKLLDSKKLTPDGEAVIKYITNIILYINSGDPDLRELKKPKLPKVTKNIKKFEKKNRHKPLLDVIEVGFNYMKGINYTVSSTVVRGHFRWQPFGEGREQVKLIWIDEHPRSFDKKVIPI